LSSREAAAKKDIDYVTLASFRAALRKFLRTSEEIAEGFGITPQQHQMLLVIRGFDGERDPTIGELATRLQVRHNSVVGLINRLSALGLVRRIADKHDRRQVHIALTAKGHAMLDKLTSAHRTELKAIAPEIHKLLNILNQD
jgi:DNA-binding MarR family transcriptional regulator